MISTVNRDEAKCRKGKAKKNLNLPFVKSSKADALKKMAFSYFSLYLALKKQCHKCMCVQHFYYIFQHLVCLCCRGRGQRFCCQCVPDDKGEPRHSQQSLFPFISLSFWTFITCIIGFMLVSIHFYLFPFFLFLILHPTCAPTGYFYYIIPY